MNNNKLESCVCMADINSTYYADSLQQIITEQKKTNELLTMLIMAMAEDENYEGATTYMDGSEIK